MNGNGTPMCDVTTPRGRNVSSMPDPTKRASAAVTTPLPEVTIDTTLTKFLRDQKARLAERTFRRYEEIVDLLRDSLNGYGHQSLHGEDKKRYEEAYEAGDEDAFCHVLGPELIAENVGELLGYFMVRKVIASEELLRAAGTVTKRLSAWMAERGYIDEQDAGEMSETGNQAARDLPRAERLGRLLFDVRDASVDPNNLSEDDYVEETLWIERVETGRLFFERGIGPVPVPEAASAIAEPGWSMFVVLGRVKGSWRLLEVGSVYPS